MTGLVEAVRSDHRAILELVDRLEDSLARWPLGEKTARRTTRALVDIEARHEVAEARVLWPVVRDTMRELSLLQSVAQRQERDGRRLLRRLDRTAATDTGRVIGGKVVAAIRLHVAVEEAQILAALDTIIDPNVSASLGMVYAKVSARSPSRPHPSIPAIPGILALTSPLTRRADRVRDRLRLR
ncbi:MAG: hemerythrin domain-containing protein [Acidobacteriota bacterium]|nr:hemerythrin domain-containing protein [Acidobacteriota bacterium]